MPEDFTPIQDELAVLKRLAGKIFDKGGARLFCPICQFESIKTAEQMAKYLNGWPKCTGLKENKHKPILVEVRPL